jgi:hypothetical protein
MPALHQTSRWTRRAHVAWTILVFSLVNAAAAIQLLSISCGSSSPYLFCITRAQTTPYLQKSSHLAFRPSSWVWKRRSWQARSWFEGRVPVIPEDRVMELFVGIILACMLLFVCRPSRVLHPTFHLSSLSFCSFPQIDLTLTFLFYLAYPCRYLHLRFQVKPLCSS